MVPVIAIEAVEAALPLADALLEGGLPVAEITFRTPAAAEVIARLARHRPALLVGAGTVLSEENVDAAKAAGARFGVAPGLNPAVVQHAAQVGLPFVPGVCTPSEIEQALGLGCRMVKFFPAESGGGVEMVKTLATPYAHTGIRFMPTGGLNAGTSKSTFPSRPWRRWAGPGSPSPKTWPPAAGRPFATAAGRRWKSSRRVRGIAS